MMNTTTTIDKATNNQNAFNYAVYMMESKSMNEMRRNAKKRPAVKKVFALLLALSMFCALLAGCDKKEETDNVTVRVGTMSGPTAMGMQKLVSEF